jgi:hypothetical protein
MAFSIPVVIAQSEVRSRNKRVFQGYYRVVRGLCRCEATRMTNSRARVCMASWDQALLQSRTMMLGAYFLVQPAGRFPECVRIVRNNPYDLLVLCHTLDDYQQETLATIARETYAPVEVLALEIGPSVDRPYADHVYEVTRGPWQLVMKCAQIVGLRIRSKVRPLPIAS